jgi:hypothetical protein
VFAGRERRRRLRDMQGRRRADVDDVDIARQQRVERGEALRNRELVCDLASRA